MLVHDTPHIHVGKEEPKNSPRMETQKRPVRVFSKPKSVCVPSDVSRCFLDVSRLMFLSALFDLALSSETHF